MFIFLRAEVNGRYVSAAGGGGGLLYPAADYIQEWESFAVTDLSPPYGGVSYLRSGDTVALQATTGPYLCAEGGGGGDVVANRSAIGSWEQWRVFGYDKASGSRWPDGGVFEPGVGITGDRNAHPHGVRIGLQAANGMWVSASSAGNGPLTANGPAYAGWEMFELGFCGGNRARTIYDGWAALPAIQ
jgi:hypothetical protein